MNKGFVQIPVIIALFIFIMLGGSALVAQPHYEPNHTTALSSASSSKTKMSARRIKTTKKRQTKQKTAITATSTVKKTSMKSAAPKKSSPTTYVPNQQTTSQQENSNFKNIEREITVLSQANNVISPSQYDRLLKALEQEAASGKNQTLVQKLKELLAPLNPYAVESTGSAVPPDPFAACGDSKPTLTADITDFSKIRKITAPGSPSSEGPKGHSFVWTEHERVPVYAPIAMVFDSGSYSKDNESSPAQYLLFFTVEENCNYQVKFDHIDEPISALKTQLPDTPKVGDSRGNPAKEKTRFETGELVGYTQGTRIAGNWDFGLYNLKEKGALSSSYGLHSNAVCWVDFYSAEKQARYRALFEGPRLVCSF